MVGQNLPEWQSRAHFFGIARQWMRQILVDHARARQAAKPGSDVFTLSLDESTALPEPRDLDLMALDEALKSSTELDPQPSRIGSPQSCCGAAAISNGVE
jgi:hypothetical protein